MKLKLITIIIALAVTAGHSNFSIGVKSGLSLYKAQDNRSLDLYNEFRPAPEVSAFCEFEATKFIYHTILLTYYQAGGKSTYQQTNFFGIPTGEEWWTTQKLDYIGIGYGLELKTQLLKVLPYVSAGVSLDYLVKTKEEMHTDESVRETHGMEDSNFKKFNVRPFLTGGLEYKIFRIAILAEYTLSYNILPYYVQEKTSTSDGIKYKTYGQFFNLGCKFYL